MRSDTQLSKPLTNSRFSCERTQNAPAGAEHQRSVSSGSDPGRRIAGATHLPGYSQCLTNIKHSPHASFGAQGKAGCRGIESGERSL